MNLKSLFKKGKKTAEERDGAESPKADAGEPRGAAAGEGAVADNAQGAAEEIRDPGAPGDAE